jgi:methionyl aminopeptidase
MDDEVKEKYLKAGRIAAEARDKGMNKIKPGVSILDVVTYIEQIILDHQSFPAFPVNIARNQVAAHFTPNQDDTDCFHEGDLVKIDVGAHVDGYIADTALTIEIGSTRYDTLCEASSVALEKAIQMMRPSVSLSDIGKTVGQTITSYGFKPIENLTGHSLNRYHLHAGLSIPNVVSMNTLKKPRVDDVIAIEPFATDGIGRVVSGKGSNIYIANTGGRFRTMRDKRSALQLKLIKKQFHSLPFAFRWCTSLFQNPEVNIQRLTHLGLLHHFPQLIEQQQGMVSQKEHTVIITDDGCEITTLGRHEHMEGFS